MAPPDQLPPLPEDAADALFDSLDPEGSEARLRAALPGAADLDAELCLRTQLARAIGLQGRHDEAMALLDEVEARAGEARREVTARALIAEGAILRRCGQAEAAAVFFEDAWALCAREGLAGLAVDAALLLFEVLPPDPGLEWLLSGLHLAEEEPRLAHRLPSLWERAERAFRGRGDLARAEALLGKRLQRLGWRREALPAVEDDETADAFQDRLIGLLSACAAATLRAEEAPAGFVELAPGQWALPAEDFDLSAMLDGLSGEAWQLVGFAEGAPRALPAMDLFEEPVEAAGALREVGGAFLLDVFTDELPMWLLVPAPGATAA